MSRSHMMVIRQRRSGAGLAHTLVGCCLSWLVVVAGVLAVPAAATAMPEPAVARPAGSGRTPTGAEPHICRPEPPEYPGCTPAQVRPLLRARFAAEYTGHARGYRFHRMGQHHRGVIFAHLSSALNAKLTRLYRAAVRRYAAGHTETITDAEGVQHRIVSYPRYRTWAGFRSHTTAMCNGNTLTIHFPTQYCWSITRLGELGRVINRLLSSTIKIVLSCNGFAIGGWASGSFAAWRLGTGVLAGGFYGAVGVEIGCQTTNLWNWASHLW